MPSRRATDGLRMPVDRAPRSADEDGACGIARRRTVFQERVRAPGAAGWDQEVRAVAATRLRGRHADSAESCRGSPALASRIKNSSVYARASSGDRCWTGAKSARMSVNGVASSGVLGRQESAGASEPFVAPCLEIGPVAAESRRLHTLAWQASRAPRTCLMRSGGQDSPPAPVRSIGWIDLIAGSLPRWLP